MHYRALWSPSPIIVLVLLTVQVLLNAWRVVSLARACVDLALLRVVMEDVASGASWLEESWFNEHH